MDISRKRKQPSILRLHKEQYHYLSLLLEQGYTLLDCLHILQIENHDVKQALEQGVDIKQILTKGNYGKFYEHLSFFLNVQTVSQAIQGALEMERFEKGILQKLIKSSIYPTCILLFSYILLFFFTQMILPQMMMSFSSLHSSFLLLGVQWLHRLCIVVFSLICIGLMFYMLLHFHHSLRLQIYKNIHTKLLLHKDHASFLFAGYLLELQKHGISTKESIYFLKEVKKASFFSLMIDDILLQLENGRDFIETLNKSEYLNHRFQTMIPLGIYSSQIEKTLKLFLTQQQYSWECLRKRISLTIQIIAYVFVGILVVIVYQMMLIPLSMLEQF